MAVRNGTGNATRQRRHYASLDPTSMGVDVDIGPVMNLSSPDFDNNRGVLKSFTSSNSSSGGYSTEWNGSVER